MAGRLPQRTPEERENFVIQNSRNLIMEEGIRNLTMDIIAKRLGISKKTLYQVVSNKQELVSRVVDYTLNNHLCTTLEIQREYSNAIDQFLLIYRSNVEIAGNMVNSLWFELKKYYPDIFARIEEYKDKFITESTLSNVLRGMDEGLFREDLNAKMIARFYSGMSYSMYEMANEFDKVEIMQEMYLYHLYGIVSDKGRAYLEKHARSILAPEQAGAAPA